MRCNRIALVVGINAYPRAPLNGCINDAQDWSAVLASAGYSVTRLTDGEATREAIMGTLGGMVKAARWCDRIVFTYSGHGTWMPDMSGDEPDGRDEALCPVDYDALPDGGSLIVDDDIAALVSHKRFGVRFTIISDSCHSGSVSRFADTRNIAQSMMPKFIPPSTFLQGEALRRAVKLSHVDPATTPRNSSGAVLMSGCADQEYSYDAFINGRYNGAFTAAAVNAIRLGRNMNYKQWHEAVREVLPSAQYPQAPQMYASVWQRRWSL